MLAIDAAQESDSSLPSVDTLNNKSLYYVKSFVQCNKCNQQFSDMSTYEAHFVSEHLNFYSCIACEFTTFQKTDLLIHSKLKHKGKHNLLKTK